jgi:non-specific serine/threonine protein kinase
MQRRHASYYVALVERAEPDLRTGKQVYWFSHLEAEHDNLRVVVAWSLGATARDDTELGLRLVGALRDFFYYSGHTAEGYRLVERALARLDDAPPAVRAKVLRAAGLLAYAHGEQERDKACLTEALSIYRDLDDTRGIAWSLIMLGGASIGQSDEYQEALSLCQEGLALFREQDDKPGIAQALNIRGELARNAGDFELAERSYQEALAFSRETGERKRESMLLHNLGYLAQYKGDYEHAERFFRDGLVRARNLDWLWGVADSLYALSGPVGSKGQPERAARLIGAAEKTYEKVGLGPQPGDLVEYERYIAAVRAQLDEAAFDAALAEGRAMTVEQAVAYALEGTDPQ